MKKNQYFYKCFRSKTVITVIILISIGVQGMPGVPWHNPRSVVFYNIMYTHSEALLHFQAIHSQRV